MTCRTKRAFTLVEVLLVGVIIAFIAAIATPSFVNSMKGQRLYQARRSVMACGRFARTLAVSRQQPMHLVLAVGGNQVTVEPGPPPKTLESKVYTREQIESRSNDTDQIALPELPRNPEPAAAAAPPSNRARMSRTLEGVHIKSLTIRDGLASEREGPITIVYKSNGTCPPYEVVLADEDGMESVVTVDFLGDATHEED